MAGGIKKTEIVEADLNQLSEDLRKVGESISFIITESAKVKPISGLSDLAKITKETAENAKNLATQQKAVLDIEAKVVALLEKEAKARAAETQEAIKNSQAKTQAIINEEKAIQAKIKTDKELLSLEKMQEQQLARNAKSVKSIEGYYNQLNASLNDNIIKYKNLTKAQLDDVNISGTLIKTIQAQDVELKQLDATMGRNQRNVGNYKSGFNGLNFSIMQVGRELPSLAYGVNVFAAAISNNIPMVTDEIKKAKLELAALKAEGKVGVPIWKQFASAIFSWQTALVVGLTLFTVYGKEIVSFIGGIFKTKEAIDELKLSQERFNKVKAEGRSEAQSELTRLSLLWGALKDVNTSADTRNKIYDELKDKYPTIFKNLSDETLNLKETEKGYWQLRDAILASAQARVFAETIAKNKSKLELELKPKLDEVTEQAKIAQKELDGLYAKADAQDDETLSISGASPAKIASAQNKLSKLKEDINIAKAEILKNEADNFRLVNMVDVGDLVNDFGKEKDKGKKNEFTALEQLKGKHKRELIEIETNQQLLLANTELSEEQILQAKVDNAKEIIRLRQTQINEEKNVLGIGAEEISTLNTEYSENEKALAKENADFVISEQKRMNKEIEDDRKEAERKRKDDAEALSNNTLSQAEEDIHKETLRLYDAAKIEIDAAKGNADKIREIQDKLEMDLIASEIRILQAKLKSGNLTVNDADQVQKRINSLEEGAAKKGIDISLKSDEEKKQIRNETMQATAELLSQGLAFAQQIYSAQATRAQEAYDAEMTAAGDSLEYQTLAKRKFEAEDKKIKQRQAIASKLQAVLDAGLALALAIATTWKNPFLAALNIGAATLGLGMALATPIPQFAEGTDFAPSSFIAGEEGSELIRTKSGKVILTPNKATLFSDNSLIGSSIIPHDQTQRMLANMAFNQVHDVIDLSKANSHLESMDKQMKSKIERSVDAKGRTVVRRGSLVSTL